VYAGYSLASYPGSLPACGKKDSGYKSSYS